MRCPIWTSLFNLSWLAPGRMPFDWPFLSLFPHAPQELAETNAALFPPYPLQIIFFFSNAWAQNEKGREESWHPGCCVQLHRLHSSRHAAEGSAAEIRGTLHLPTGGSGQPCPLRGGEGQRSRPSEHWSHQPCLFLLLLFVFSSLSPQQQTYMKSLAICFSLQGKVNSCSRNSSTGN